MADHTIRKDENLNKISGGTEVIIDQYRTPAELPDFDPNKLPKMNPGPGWPDDSPIVKEKK